MACQSRDAAGWSVVMTGRPDNLEAFDEAARQAFGREGLDTFSLVLGKDHLPAELADGLTEEQAKRIADQLREIGAAVETIPTDRVAGVRHRAGEVWANRCTDTFCFTEVDGLITILSALNARENLLACEAFSRWRMEAGMNHIHVGLGDPQEKQVEEGERLVQGLTSALRQAYPGRSFTISHTPDEVTFWQTTPDSPREGRLSRETRPDKVWCHDCKRMRELHPSTHRDPRLLNDEWRECAECGTDVLVRYREKLVFVGATAD